MGSEFKTVGPTVAKARVPKVLQWTRGTVDDKRLIADDGDFGDGNTGL